MSFSWPAMPPFGCSVSSSKLLCLFVSDRVPDILAWILSSLISELNLFTLGSLTVKDIVLSPTLGKTGLGFLGTDGNFLFSPRSGFVKGPEPTFLPLGTNLVALKRKWPRTFGFLDNVGLTLVPSVAIVLLKRGLVLAITEVEESMLGPSKPPTFTESDLPSSSLLPFWSKTSTSGDG